MPLMPLTPPKSPALAEQGGALGERRLVLAGTEVVYHLHRSARRSTGLCVDQRGLTVRAPLRLSLAAIERTLHAHADWVLAKLAAWAARPCQPPERWQLLDGARLPLLGTPITLRWQVDGDRRRGFGRWLPDALLLQTPADSDPYPLLLRLLRERAREAFLQRLAFWAPQMGLAMPPLVLSSARTRWGSCNAQGVIRLHWRLIHLPLALLDYVVVHELAHRHEMNHSPAFWAHVTRLLPDWPMRRKALRAAAPHLPLIEVS